MQEVYAGVAYEDLHHSAWTWGIVYRKCQSRNGRHDVIAGLTKTIRSLDLACSASGGCGIEEYLIAY